MKSCIKTVIFIPNRTHTKCYLTLRKPWFCVTEVNKNQRPCICCIVISTICVTQSLIELLVTRQTIASDISHQNAARAESY